MENIHVLHLFAEMENQVNLAEWAHVIYGTVIATMDVSRGMQRKTSKEYMAMTSKLLSLTCLHPPKMLQNCLNYIGMYINSYLTLELNY